MAHTTQATTLANAIWPSSELTPPLMRNAILVVVGSLLIAISAKISVPFYPVPITMQTFVILAMGMAFGWRLGGATVLLYLAEGAMGLPVFAGTPEKGIGLAYMAGPTGGYLVGYLMAVVSVGWLAEKGWDRNTMTTLGAMLIGTILIYAPGLLWLGTLFGWDKPIIEWGLIPFLPGDGFKIGLAAAVLPMVWKLMDHDGE